MLGIVLVVGLGIPGAVVLAGAVTLIVAMASALGLQVGVDFRIVAVPPALAALVVFAWLSDTATKTGRQGIFLALYVPAMILFCLGAAKFLSPLWSWGMFGPGLLFVGLLTMLNAPFDWASLGMTRALLRRGLELRGWWPYALALVDACLAAMIIAALALTMVVGVQDFDALGEYGGGEPVLPLDPLFNGIATRPSAPEYWWLYALLLSTMIPSLV